MYFSFLQEEGMIAKLTPVPRKVSASCGTCVYFEADMVVELTDCEIEAIYMEADGKFLEIWSSSDE